MAKNAYIGVGGVARRVKNPYIGIYQEVQNGPHNLPSGYTELEYIESTGTQYINTGVVCDSSNYEFCIKFKKDNAVTDANLMCASTNDTQWPVGVYFGLANRISFAVGNSASHNYYNVTQGAIYEYKAYVDTASKKWTVSVNGSQVGTGSYSGNVSTNSVYLLAHNNSGSPIQFCPATVYSFTAKKNGQLVRNFIPAKRNSDSAIGMYDLVNSKFYANAGSGKFTAGAAIPATAAGSYARKAKNAYIGVGGVARKFLGFDGYIVKNGVIDSSIEFIQVDANYSSAYYGTVTYNPLKIERKGASFTFLRFKIDLSLYTKAHLTFSAASANGTLANFWVTSIVDPNDATKYGTELAYNNVQSAGTKDLTVNLANVSDPYLCIGVVCTSVGTNASVTIKDFWLE